MDKILGWGAAVLEMLRVALEHCVGFSPAVPPFYLRLFLPPGRKFKLGDAGEIPWTWSWGGGAQGAVQRGWAMALGRRMARGVALCQIRGECCSPAPGEDCCSYQTPFGDFSPSCVRAG